MQQTKGTRPQTQWCQHPTPTVKAAPTVLVVDVLREAVLLEQLVGRVLELGQGLRGAAVASDSWGAL